MATAYLTSKGVLVKEQDLINLLGVDLFLKFKSSFKRTVKQPFDKYKSATMVKRQVNKRADGTTYNTLLIWRFLAYKYLTKGYITMESKLSPGHSIHIPSFNAIEIDIQTITKDYIINKYFTQSRINQGIAGAVVEFEAGLGKTFLAARFIMHFQAKTLYIVPTVYLLKQAYDDLKICFPNTTIGKYYANEKTDGDIVIMVINSAAKDSFQMTDNTINIVKDKKSKKQQKSQLMKVSPKQYFDQFRIAIWDECHEYASDTGKKAFANINRPISLGITAESNDRPDKMDFIVHYNIGEVVIAENIPGYDLPDDKQYYADTKVIQYYGPSDYTQLLINEYTGMMQCAAMTRQIMQDPYRMRILLEEILRLYNEGHNMFIWCDLREVVQDIKTNIIKYAMTVNMDIDLLTEDNIGNLMGGITDQEIKQAKRSRIIIATYQYAYRGVSLPQFDAMVLATPRRGKMYQILKRIFRLGGNYNIRRQIVDIVDMNTNLKKQFTDRNKQYKNPKFGMTVTKQKIKYEDIDPLD